MAESGAGGGRTRCPACGARVSPVARFCSSCGAPTARDRSCSSCGARSPQGSDVCEQCQASNSMGWSCPVCGAQVAEDATSCPQCGTALAPADVPLPAEKVKPKRSPGCLVVAAASLLLLCLACVSIVAIAFVLDLPTKVEMSITGRVHEVGGPKEAWDEIAQRAAVEKVAAALETAFRAQDVNGAVKLVDPELQQTYSELFAAHRGELPTLADILATRTLTTINNPFAEYAVTDGERKSSIRLILIDGHWFLASI